MEYDFDGRTAFITGTTRGIGKQIALTLAEKGCNIVSTGKTVEEGGELPGSIHKTKTECEARGVDAKAIQLNLRDETQITEAVDEAIDHFGEIDIVINNASAIQLANVAEMPANRFDLVTDVNVRGTYLTSRAFIPHLRSIGGGHILTNAPPVTTDRSPGSAAYAWSKLGMSFVTLSLARELRNDSIAANTIWPVTGIDTRATRYFGLGTEDDWRTSEIVADSVLEILDRDPDTFSGNACYDEEILQEIGIESFSEYNVTPGDPAPTSAQLFDPEFERSW